MRVSLVMPTYNRARFVPIAIRCFFQQTYADKELIIVDDGTEPLALPDDPRIRYIKLAHREPTGTKRNYGADAAKGRIIANLDDDDWSSAHRIEDQVRRLTTTGKAVTGYNATVLWDESTGRFWRNPGGPPYFSSGTSQCYTKEWWKQHPFPPASYGEDSVFSRTARLADQLAIADPGQMMVVRKHAGNTDPVQLKHMQPIPPPDNAGQFYRAVEVPTFSAAYLLEAHDCHTACSEDARRQFEKFVVEYKTNSIPEIKTR